MDSDTLAALQKQVRKAKRIATEKASDLHDLVEDNLPAGYEQLPVMAQECYDACQAWAEANVKFEAAQQTGPG